MPLPFPYSARRSLDEREQLMESRQHGISGLIVLAGVILLVLVLFLASLLVLNPLMELYKLEQDRDQAQDEFRRAKAAETQAYNEFHWMMDPEYFEQVARDRANQAKAGETVIHRPAPERRPNSATPPPQPARN